MTYSNYSDYYSDFFVVKLDKTIVYEEYITEHIGSINYADYLAEQLDKNITYADYLLENAPDEIKRKRLERKISRQKRKRNGKLKDILRSI